jgi:predicted metal-dependent RNase
VDESKAINNKPGPMIIISASGMAETGPFCTTWQ